MTTKSVARPLARLPARPLARKRPPLAVVVVARICGDDVRVARGQPPSPSPPSRVINAAATIAAVAATAASSRCRRSKTLSSSDKRAPVAENLATRF